MVKYIPVYAEKDGVNPSDPLILSYEVPDGYYAELYAVGVIPDYDPTTGVSNLQGIQIAHSNTKDQVGSIFEYSKISANYGRNIAVWGAPGDKQLPFTIDTPGIPGNMTYKFGSGKYIQIVGITSATTGLVRAKAEIALYTPDEIEAIFGVSADEFCSLPGGSHQSNPVLKLFHYVDLPATDGTGRWNDLYDWELSVHDFITLEQIRVASVDHAKYMQLYDDKTSKYYPQITERPWNITPEINDLPFGDANEYQPPRVVPPDLAAETFNQTTLHVRVQDDGTAAEGIRVQFIGTYIHQ